MTGSRDFGDTPFVDVFEFLDQVAAESTLEVALAASGLGIAAMLLVVAAAHVTWTAPPGRHDGGDEPPRGAASGDVTPRPRDGARVTTKPVYGTGMTKTPAAGAQGTISDAGEPYAIERALDDLRIEVIGKVEAAGRLFEDGVLNVMVDDPADLTAMQRTVRAEWVPSRHRFVAAVPQPDYLDHGASILDATKDAVRIALDQVGEHVTRAGFADSDGVIRLSSDGIDGQPHIVATWTAR